MSKLIALLAVLLAGALAAVLFWRRKSEESWSSVWSSAEDSGSSWSKTAAHESGKEVSDLADEVEGSASQAAHKAGEAAERAAKTPDDATTAATDLVDEVKGGNPI